MARRESDDFVDDGLSFNIFFDDDGDESGIETLCEAIQEKIAVESSDYVWHSGPPAMVAARPQHAGGDIPAAMLTSFTPSNLRRPCISGILEHGDNVEDEWFATWLLIEAAKEQHRKGAVLQFHDADGDFLLIEAADAELPSWIQPERMANRVFVAHGGKLCLVPPKSLGGLGGDDEPVPSAEEGADWVRKNPLKAIASAGIQAAVADRLRGYPQRAFRNMHCALAYLPPVAAAVLSAAPQLIASAVSAFYSRDSSEVVRASRMTFFAPPDPDHHHHHHHAAAASSSTAAAGSSSIHPSLVPMSVPMTRHLFAQLIQQRFLPPKSYARFMPPPPMMAAAGPAAGSAASAASARGPAPLTTSPEEYQRYDLGLKIATGLEILMRRGRGAKIVEAAAVATTNAVTTAAEAAAIGDSTTSTDIRSSDRFKRYLASLTRRGYFEGVRSKEERETKLQAAERYFLASPSSSASAASAPSARDADEDAAAGTLVDITSLTKLATYAGNGGDGGASSTTELASALLGKLLVRIKPALPTLMTLTLLPASAAGPPALPFKWPPSCARDDSTAWLWADGDDDEAEGEESGGEKKEKNAPSALSAEASAKATASILNQEMDRFLSASKEEVKADSKASSSSDMEELRGLLKKLSGFVRSNADYEGAEPEALAAASSSGKTQQRSNGEKQTKAAKHKPAPPALDKEAFLREVQLHLEWQQKRKKGLVEKWIPPVPSPSLSSSADKKFGEGQADEADEADEDDEMMMLSLSDFPAKEEHASSDDDEGADDDNEEEEEDEDDLLFDDEGQANDEDDEEEDGAAPGSIPKELLDLKELMRAMEAELFNTKGGGEEGGGNEGGGSATTLGQSFLKASSGGGSGSGSAKGSDSLSDADLRFNLLSSLAASVGGQAGAAGPASNILGTLGAKVPSQWWKAGEEESDDDDEERE